MALASCSQKPMVITGNLEGYEGEPASLSTFMSGEGVFIDDTIPIMSDGSFHYENTVEKVLTGFIAISKYGSTSVVFIPGEKYNFKVDMSVKPAIWEYEGRNKAEMDYYAYYKEAVTTFGMQYPDTFEEYSKIWDEREQDLYSRLKSLHRRDVKAYFNERIPQIIRQNKFNYAFQLKKRGLSMDADADYNEFFNSIDLTDGYNVKYMLPKMISVKKNLYSDTIPELERQIAATRELSPSQIVADTLVANYISKFIINGEITNERDAATLEKEVDNLIEDEATKAEYKGIIDKSRTLFEGCPEIDFEMIDTDGKPHMLSEFKGKAVYIDFWATWCLPCCIQIPSMEKIAAKYASDKRIVCMSVSFDKNVDSWKSKLAFDKPQWPQYRTDDAGKAISLAYGFRGIPRFMLFDKEGKIVTVCAPRPSDAENLTVLIDSVLNK